MTQGGGIRGEIIVPARRLELKHDATEVELTSTVRFYYTKKMIMLIIRIKISSKPI